MRKLFITLLVMAVITMTTACHYKAPEPEGEKLGNYFGTVEVDNDDEHFVKENVEVSVTKEESGDKYTIKLYRVKFATAMPVEIDMLIEGVSIDEKGTISGNEIIPYAMGGPFEKYTITGLSGEMTDNTLRFEMTCGKYPTKYTGTRN